MSNKFISKGQRNVCVTFVKYYPVLMQVIMFRFCIWRRLLIYSMIFNICVEWVTVNIEMPIEHNIVVWSVMAVTLLIIIASIVLRFKTGCFENEGNSDRDAA